jgi:hypothetical protein
MPTRSKVGVAKRKGGATKSAAKSNTGVAAAASNTPSSRRVVRQGRRTTLRVPPSLAREVARIAEERGTSENEALLHLAGLGVASADRQSAVRRLAARRQAAVLAEVDTNARGLPSPEDSRAAISVDRDK